MLRDEAPTPGPKVTFLQAGQPLAKGKEQAADEQPMSSAERCFDKTWLVRAMEKMECRLHATIRSSLDPVAHNMNELEACVTSIEEQVVSRDEDKQKDDSPPDSGWQRELLAKPCPAVGRELRASPLQGRLATATNYTNARSTHFEQMDIDPPEDNGRQEPIMTNDSHNARVEDEDESANDLWRMGVEALFMSLDEAKRFSHLQPTKRQEILMPHLYKPPDGYKINHGLCH